MNTNFQSIPLTDICPSPVNPRKDFAGSKFEELVASIKQKGVIEPIIVRPIAKKKTPFEIVAGERRFRASTTAGLAEIPAIVRELTDDEAYDFMLIENLQRQDLSEREEAESFKAYVDRHGEEAVKDLAEKTGIRPGYIRARIAILALPEPVLKAWEKGDLVFGHLHQLLRVTDPGELKEVSGWLLERLRWGGGQVASVKELAAHIEDEAPAISAALFKTAECCRSCPSNSAVQKELFGVESKVARCLNPACFKKRQGEFLTANWKTAAIAKKTETNGFIFNEDHSYRDVNHFERWNGDAKPGTKCKACPNFVTVMELSGKVFCERVCSGEKSCFNAITKPKTDREKTTGERDPEAPRAAWHGEYFRDVFLSKRIPEVLAKLDPGDPKIKELLLVCAIHGNKFAADGGRDYSGWILGQPADVKTKAFKAVVEKVVLSGQHVGPSSYNGFGTKGRRLVAEFLGIDLAKEFSADAEYLEKKTKAELLAFGRTFKIFAQAKKLMKTKLAAADPEKLKKSELVKLILQSGVDLVGLVPKEILK